MESRLGRPWFFMEPQLKTCLLYIQKVSSINTTVELDRHVLHACDYL